MPAKLKNQMGFGWDVSRLDDELPGHHLIFAYSLERFRHFLIMQLHTNKNLDFSCGSNCGDC